MPANACPCDDRLQGLLDGSICDRDVPALMAHLDHCACCRRRLDALAGSPGTWHGLARNLRGKDREGEESPALAAVLADLRSGPDEEATGPAPSRSASAVPARVGRYQIERLVGRGGMGRVYKAFDPSLRRVVAVKLLNDSLAADPTARSRFLREARAVASITHDHVVTIHEVDEEAGQPYIVMQFIHGESLQTRVDRLGALRLRDVLLIGTQVAAGLAAAHAQGIVHRDVKPGNILLEKGLERARITDFGLARVADDVCATETGDVLGTPQYMSPEQARGEAVDHRSDLFSLGAVLYTMCTGERPFRAGPALSVLKRVCEEEPRPIRRTNPEVPAWLAAIVEKLMAKDPDRRFQSAGEVADLLERHLAHVQQPDAVPPPAPIAAVAAPAGPWTFWGVVEAIGRGLYGVLAALILFIVALALTGDRHIDKHWPGVLIAMGFVGLVPVLWEWRWARQEPARLRRWYWLLGACLLASFGGIVLAATDHGHSTARHLFWVMWPLALLGFIGYEVALLYWAFRRRGRRRRWLIVLVVVVVALLLLIFLSCLGLSVSRQARVAPPVGQGGIQFWVGDPAIKVKVEGRGAKVQEFTGGIQRQVFLPPGSYTVTATKDGEVLYQDQVQVFMGGLAWVNISGDGWVKFLPSDVMVQIDGKQVVARQGMNVRVGRHTWVARKAGKEVGRGEFFLRPEERKVIPVTTSRRDDTAEEVLATVRAFFKAALAGRWKEAAAHGEPGRAYSREKKIKEFAALKGQEPTLLAPLIDRDQATVLTTPVKIKGREGPLHLRLVKVGERWLIRDIDHVTRDGAKGPGGGEKADDKGP
jgi:serine/threonine-protein kinase